MENLPSGWAVELLGKLCSITTGSKDVNEGNPVGQYPFFTCAQEISKCNAYSFDGAAILIAGNGNFSVKKYEGKFEAYQRTYVLQNFAIAHNYLFYFISHRLGEITKDNFGSTIRYIRIGNLTDYPVSFPSINEQHRIVAKIEELFSELDQGVVSLRTAREQIKVYRQSLLKNAFEGKLTAAWRAAHADQLETSTALQQRIARERQARYQQQLADWQTAGQPGPKPKPPKPLPALTAEELAELPELPEGWGWVKLGEIISLSSGSALTASQMKPGLFPVYGGNGISGFHDEYLVESAQLILGRVGVKCGVVHITRPKSWITDNALIVSFLIEGFDLGFMKYCFENLNLNKVSVSTAQPVISGSKIYPVAIALPALTEQQVITQLIDTKLSEADQLDQTLATALQQADALRQSILKKAFCGQLVHQDKNDEPATALLERIRAGKSNGMSAPRNRRKSG